MKKNEMANSNPLVTFIIVSILFMLFSVMFSSCEKDTSYDRDICCTLLNKYDYLKEQSKQSYMDSVAVYTSMTWKSNNADLLKHCRYWNQIHQITTTVR